MNKKFKKRFKKDFVMFYLGIGLYIFFLLLWFFTLPSVEEIDERPLDEFVSEQIEAVKKSEQDIIDESNYLRAVATDNNVFCNGINNSNLKEQCFDEVINFEDLIPDNRSEQDILDESNFLRATTMGDISFCEKIVNLDLRSECISSESSDHDYYEDEPDTYEFEDYFEEDEYYYDYDDFEDFE